MTADCLPLDVGSLRGSDSNSLLRLYDLARERLGTARTPQERDRADKALERIAGELRRRQVPH